MIFRFGSIFLIRNSNLRKILNIDQVMAYFNSNNISIIDCTKYKIEEQISIFNNSKLIIAQAGSAVVNSIFCKKITKLLILAPKTDDNNLFYWPRIIQSSSKLIVHYMMCKTLSNKSYNADYFVNINELDLFIKKIL